MSSSVVQMFKETPMRSPMVPRSVFGNYSVDLDTPANRAMRLAASEDFFSMCSASLWGNESKEEFGEMLRGLVESYLPKTRWDLMLLSNAADAQWKILRLRRLQQALYLAQDAAPGKDGVSKKTEIAMSYDDQLNKKMNLLEHTIRVYLKRK